MIKFAYPEDYGIKMPFLALTIRNGHSFKPGKLWIPLRHQTAGIACNQHEFIVDIVPVSEKTQEAMSIISDHFFDTNLGTLWAQLNEVNEYRKLLNTLLDVDCNNTFHDLEEGLYPIDIEGLWKLNTDYPKDLDDFLEFKTKWDKFLGFANRWKLYIIGPNSD